MGLRDADVRGPERRNRLVATMTRRGRLGQFGQPIIRRKSEELAKQFAANVAAALADPTTSR